MEGKSRELGVTTRPGGSWVQVERAAMERWAKLTVNNPRASALLMAMLAEMGRHNALVASQTVLARLAGCSVRTVQRSLDALRAGLWIEVRQIGMSGTTNAYIVNDRVAWSGNRDGIRYSLFSAAILVSDDEQPDRAELDTHEPLIEIPALFPARLCEKLSAIHAKGIIIQGTP